MRPLKLGINIDHVATIRNARGGIHPDPMRAAILAQEAGADSITIHLREDRRHIIDADVFEIAGGLVIPLNLEMAATEEMKEIALKLAPQAICLVPEKREEKTTEGGLNAFGAQDNLKEYVAELQNNGSVVSLFIEPSEQQIRAAHNIGAKAIEFHTGRYCDAVSMGDYENATEVLSDLHIGARLAASLDLEVHAGHGITYDSVTEIARIPEVSELNIGHFLIGEAIYIGLKDTIIKMRQIMDDARRVSF
jgi:pyridoxine 5-phosphate synthase